MHFQKCFEAKTNAALVSLPHSFSLSASPLFLSLEHIAIFICCQSHQVADLTKRPPSYDSCWPPLLNSRLISPVVADHASRPISPSWLLPSRGFISTFFFFFFGFFVFFFFVFFFFFFVLGFGLIWGFNLEVLGGGGLILGFILVVLGGGCWLWRWCLVGGNC